jgi:hypothetical protein
VFILLNAPLLTYMLIASLSIYSDGTILLQWDSSIPKGMRHALAQIYTIHLIGLNSCINPMIYFIRIEEFRSHVLSPRRWTSTPASRISILEVQSKHKRLNTRYQIIHEPTPISAERKRRMGVTS